MPASPWNADLDRMKKELSTRLDKVETAVSKNDGADTAKSVTLMQRQLAELKNDSESTEKRITVDMKQISSIFATAKNEIDKLQAQVNDLKSKVESLTKQVAQAKTK